GHHRPARALGAVARLPAVRPVAGRPRRAGAVLSQRQPLGPPAGGARPGRDRHAGAGVDRAGGAAAVPGTDGERVHGPDRGRARPAAGPVLARRPPGHGRLRDGLLVALVAAPLPRRVPEDRPVVRGRAADRPDVPRHRGRRGVAVGGPRALAGGRGGRDRRGRPPPAGARLPLRPGLSLRPAAARRGGDRLAPGARRRLRASRGAADGGATMSDPAQVEEEAEAERGALVDVLIEELERLPAQPSVAVRTVWVADQPHSSAKDLAAALTADPSLTARVLRLANSAYYGLSRRVADVAFAVTVVGFPTVRAMAAVHASGLFEPGEHAVPDG